MSICLCKSTQYSILYNGACFEHIGSRLPALANSRSACKIANWLCVFFNINKTWNVLNKDLNGSVLSNNWIIFDIEIYFMRKITFAIGLLVLCFNLFAQTPGDNDSIFNANDLGYYNGEGVNGGSVYASLIQPDGKIIIAGLFSSYNTYGKGSIVRILPNGLLDNTFMSSGVFYNPIKHNVSKSKFGILSIFMQHEIPYIFRQFRR